jgi:hypothetical protein
MVTTPMTVDPTVAGQLDTFDEVWACQVVTPSGTWKFTLDGAVIPPRDDSDVTDLVNLLTPVTPAPRYEYQWCNVAAMSLMEEGASGWRVVPGIYRSGDYVDTVLMERVVAPEPYVAPGVAPPLTAADLREEAARKNKWQP